jgi:hypothetical protein
MNNTGRTMIVPRGETRTRGRRIWVSGGGGGSGEVFEEFFFQHTDGVIESIPHMQIERLVIFEGESDLRSKDWEEKSSTQLLVSPEPRDLKGLLWEPFRIVQTTFALQSEHRVMKEMKKGTNHSTIFIRADQRFQF